MAVVATQEGRNLVLTVEGVADPFVIKPLPGRRGQELTAYFLAISTAQKVDQDMPTILNWAVNGVDENGDWIDIGENSERILNTLTQEEGSDIYMPAFYWSTVLGLSGVVDYFSAGGGMAGGLKAMRTLLLTLGISKPETLPNSGSESLTQEASTPTMSTPNGGGTLEKLPPAKRSRWQNRKRQ